MKPLFIFLILFFVSFSYPSISFANLDLITWKGIYYQAIPNKKNISMEYCKAHTPGTFIHTVKDTVAYTNKGIKLDNPTFHMQKKQGIYLIHGDIWASGKTKNVPWHDHIYYYAYKLSEAGITQGVWSSNECKGRYIGFALYNKNHLK